MDPLTMIEMQLHAAHSDFTRRFEDPLIEDMVGDTAVVTTRRGLTRLAVVAAETGARFQREGVPDDPMNWMLAPRALFDGASALDACLGSEACLRGILVHGLSLDLDPHPDVIDTLMADKGDDALMAETGRLGADILPFSRQAEPELRLFTATIVSYDLGENVQAFHASLATDESEVAGRLYCRVGAISANARICAGFRPDDPLVTALVSEAMCDTLALVAENPGSPLAAGLDVNIEQRFWC